MEEELSRERMKNSKQGEGAHGTVATAMPEQPRVFTTGYSWGERWGWTSRSSRCQGCLPRG
jgi:hypothetical protein